ncbi:hypothetical protein ACLOJK_011427 [Asimina triloba]
MNPGVFPTVTHVRAEVGGSWYIVKDILKEMKEKLMVDTQIQRLLDSQVMMQATPVRQDTNAEATSEATKMTENPDTAASKDTAQLSETMTGIQIDQKLLDSQVRMQATSVTQDINEGATSEAIKMEGNPDTAASKDIGQLSGTVTDFQIDQRTLDSQVRMQATSVKQDINAEATSEATKREEIPDTSASKNTAKASATVTDIQIDPRSMLGEELLVTSERSLNAAMTEEFPDISRVSESQDGDLPVAKHPAKVMKHANGEEAEKLARMISQLSSNVRDRGSLNDETSNKSKVVINGDKLLERKMTSLAPEQRSAPSTVPALNGQPVSRLAYLFQGNQTGERSHKKICMQNGAERNARVSNASSDDVNGNKKYMKGLFDIVKDISEMLPKDTHLNKLNRNSEDPRHDNSLGIMPDMLNHLKPSEEQKKLDRLNICNEVGRPKQIDINKVDEEAKIPVHNHDFQFEIEDESGNESDYAAVDYPMLESNTQIRPTQPTTNGIFLHTEKGRKQNHLMVKFLPKSATEKDVHVAFASCGPIAKISIVPSRNENWFNYAHVYFKTEEGLRKAVSRANTYVAGGDVLVESISPMLNVPNKVCAPDVVDDPNFPMALLKNPKRTVMVEGLHQDIASHHLIRALSFCGHISGFSMGSSTDVAYVEFESLKLKESLVPMTEDAKEKALAASSISIFGTQLSLYRIDIPQTTVVRITNVGETQYQEIFRICRSHGQIKKDNRVGKNGQDSQQVIDQRYVAYQRFYTGTYLEPLMLAIFGSLNGMVVDGHQWIAQPGTLIPFEILRVLLKEPDGQRYVHSLARDLSVKIGGGLTNTTEATGILKEYYGLKA